MRYACCRLEGRSGHEAGWALLRQLYLEETGLALPPVRLSGTGKPYFPNSPYFFSISHTRRHAACVLGKHPVGIDMEELDRPFRLKIAGRILSPGEYAQFTRAADQRRAFLTFWVLKEALVKCRGTGLQGFPNHTDFSLPDPRVWEWDGCLVAMIVEQKGISHAF